MIAARDVLAVVVVTGDPIGKGRPRLTRSGRAYTPRRTRDYEARVSQAAREVMGSREPYAGPLALLVEAYHARPAKPAKHHPCRDAGPDAFALAMGGSRYPDADNVLKAAADGCNGVLYGDDAQLAEVTCRRLWCAAGDEPRIVLTLTRV